MWKFIPKEVKEGAMQVNREREKGSSEERAKDGQSLL